MAARSADRSGLGHTSSRDPDDLPEAPRAVELQTEKDALDRERQLRGHKAVLTALSLSGTIDKGDVAAAQRQIAEAAAQALDVARVGIWLFNEDRTQLRCIELYEREAQRHTSGVHLNAADYPRYFASLDEDRCLPADDAQQDPRTNELTDAYLVPLGITSMIDAPLRLAGRLVGVVCHEHVGPKRSWTLAEQAFAGSIADFVALTLQARRRHEAEAAIKEQRTFLKQLIDLNPNLIFVKDRQGRFQLVNQAVADIYGTSVDELIGRTDADFNDNAEQVAYFRQIDNHVMNSLEQYVIREEAITDARGRLHWLQTVKRPLVGSDGRANQVLGVSVDITERKIAQERQELMVRELDHRVKNNLSTVLGLAEQTARGSASIEQFLPAFAGRIRSMAVAHELLANTSWTGVQLRDVVERLLRPYVAGEAAGLSIEGEPLTLPPKVAAPLCLIIHELATNAVKHGSLAGADVAQGQRQGHVHVSWSADASTLTLHWEERNGPPVVQPERMGFGVELIECIARHQLRGKAQLRFDRDGVQCTIHMPLDPPQPQDEAPWSCRE